SFNVVDTVAVLAANDTSYQINLSTTDTIYVKVSAFNEFASSPRSEALAVSLRGTSFINAPSNLTVEYVTDGRVLLSWNDNSSFETSYVIESKLVSERDYTDIFELAADTTSYEFLLPSFTEAYNYRVYGKNEYWNSDPSNPVAASIAILSNQEAISDKITLYPNPSKGILNISNIGQQEIQEVLILDLKGSLIKKIDNNIQEIDLNSFSNGLYLIQIHTQKDIYSYRVMLSK
ncbi:MAG: T9SS type A sorting domain-containing protein, partial [Nitrososphaeraceae archaeon]|nr:T9SS type A sorting domain-containing protein [Nitrososphaeraceae archaeon]